MRFRFNILAIVFSIILSGSVIAQETCDAIVQEAIETASRNCDSLRRNQVCYGNNMIDAEAAADISDFTFETPGDIVGIASIASIRLGNRIAETGEWGISLMNLQADLPDDESGNIIMVIFGDVEIQNSVVGEPIRLTVTALSGVNIRNRPFDGAVIGSLSSAEETQAIGRNAANTWIQVQIPDTNDTGWVSADYLSGDDETLPIIELGSPRIGPMQSFYFRSGYADAPCEAAPESGMLLQTPDGVGRIGFTINELTVEIGSTIFLQTNSEYLFVYVLEGSVLASTADVTQIVPAGTYTKVPINETTIVSGNPEYPKPYESEQLENLPIVLLPEAIEIAAPLETEEIQAAVQEIQGEVDTDDGSFRPTEGIYNQNWSVGIFNTAQILVIDELTISWQVLGGNPTPTILTLVAPNTYSGSGVTITFTSPTSYTVTTSEATATGVLQ
jgi:hypothetical protein